MKRILIIVFIVLFFIAFSIWLFLYIYNYRSEKEQSSSDYHLTKDEIALIHDGDFVLRHGYGFVSDLIVQRLGEVYDISHCAIACKDSNGITIIHSVSQSLSPYDGVQSQDMETFIRDSKKNSVVIVRYKPKKSGMDNSRISRRARQYLEKRIPFDHAFDINDSTEFYCQELPWKCILNEFGDDILMDHYNHRKDHLRFDTFLDTSRFEIILNHQLRKQKDHSLHNISIRYIGNSRHSMIEP
jgi:hypothetical protein